MQRPIQGNEAKGFRRRPLIIEYIGTGGLDEDEAQATAEEIVRSVRNESFAHNPEGLAPDSAKVRERREAYHRDT